MSFMILAGGLDRLTTVLTANYNDLLTESISISGPVFKDWLRGFKVRERKGKHKVRHERKKKKLRQIQNQNQAKKKKKKF